MALSNDLVKQFAKITNDNKTTNGETTVYGTTVMYDGSIYVKIDGSDLLTPVETTSSMRLGERVMVMIKNHSATVTGNVTDPSAGIGKVEQVEGDVKDAVDKISEFEIVVSYKVSTEELEAITATIASLKAITGKFNNMEAINAEITNLEAKYAELEYVKAEDVEALNAVIENLEAEFGKFSDISTEDLEAINAEITNLKSYNADFTYVSADVLSAIKANIKTLDTEKLSAKDANLKYANIDFANIGEAAIEKLFSDSGIIRDLVMSEGHITGKLVGVTIVGDLIEGGTVKADKLVVLGEDGLYYKLNVDAEKVSAQQTEYNSLSGKIITAKSITAEKVNVDDLVAFDATIGGFNITEDSLYSGVKKSVDNTTRGVYLDNTGQIAFGDSDNYIRYFKDQNGDYKLEISAASIVLGAHKKTVEEIINDIEVGARNLIRNSKNMIFDDYWFYESDGDDGGEGGDDGDTEEPVEVTYLADELGNMLLDDNDDIFVV